VKKLFTQSLFKQTLDSEITRRDIREGGDGGDGNESEDGMPPPLISKFIKRYQGQALFVKNTSTCRE
jgi:hypothetical protein